MVLALINMVCATETVEGAHEQWRIIADRLRAKFPKLATLLDESETVLVVMDFPEAQGSARPFRRVRHIHNERCARALLRSAFDRDHKRERSWQ
jgi:hypothetical protein